MDEGVLLEIGLDILANLKDLPIYRPPREIVEVGQTISSSAVDERHLRVYKALLIPAYAGMSHT